MGRLYTFVGKVIIEVTGDDILLGYMVDGDLPMREEMETITPDEARMLAAHLIDAAELVERK